MANLEVGRLHALLVAIENYPRSPLFGCVNDIDQVGDFLVNRLGVPAASIRKMVAPADESQPAESPPELDPESAPTYANIVAALKYLAGDPVQPGDRVFIYYCGHGSYRKMPEAEAYFEGLVPQDFAESGLLFDVELNELLQAIAERCHDLTVVLDCCHSAGATRKLPSRLEDVRARFLSLPAGALAQGVAPVFRAAPPVQRQSPRAQPHEYTVVAACHADETAAECRMPPKVGPPHGLFTYCLLDLLSGLEPAALDTARWSDIWEQLKAAVTGHNPAQRPQLLGPKERRVFGGPWQPQDLGFAISANPDGSYRIGAGRLAGLGPGAQVAVYGPAPARFPPLDSEEDKQVRIGLLTVDSVEQAQATASVQPAPFAVPAGTRGRLIRLGAPDLLRVTLARDVDAEVIRCLAEKPSGNRFILLRETDSSAEVHVGQYPGGDLWIGDDLYGPGEPFEDTAPRPHGPHFTRRRSAGRGRPGSIHRSAGRVEPLCAVCHPTTGVSPGRIHPARAGAGHGTAGLQQSRADPDYVGARCEPAPPGPARRSRPLPLHGGRPSRFSRA